MRNCDRAVWFVVAALVAVVAGETVLAGTAPTASVTPDPIVIPGFSQGAPVTSCDATVTLTKRRYTWTASIESGTFFTLAPSSGTSGGSLTVTAVAGLVEGSYAGSVYVVSNDDGADVSVPVTLTVTPTSLAPVAVDDAEAATEDETLEVSAPGVLANDSSPGGGTLSASLVSDASNGSVSLSSDGSYTYTPAPDFFGADSFTYVANDGSLDSNVGTVTLTVSGINDEPIAYGQSVTTEEETPVSITLTATDADGDPLTWIVTESPMEGALDALGGADFLYTPDAGFVGKDSFMFVVDDGSVVSGTAAVSIIVGGVHFADPVDWDLGNQRWSDIADNAYDLAMASSYLYSYESVQFAHYAAADTLTGTLTGVGLKPNFAYQMKLNGKPTYVWDADGDDWANEQVGYAGRWWTKRIDLATGLQDGAGWNGTDAEYEIYKAIDFDDGEFYYLFEGYLLFDFAVTDADGALASDVALDSSYHVLWKTSQRTPAVNDGAPKTSTVTALASSDWYDQDHAETEVSIYGEWQTGRALPGELSLPAGEYNVRLFLTEESFHSADGYWATVLVFDHLAFAVESGDPGALTLSATGYTVRNYRYVDLSWEGGAGGAVDVLRDGTPIATGVTGGAYTDSLGKKTVGSFTYQVIEVGGGAVSNTVTVTF